MCMSRLISFVFADSSCEPRKESENYKTRVECQNVLSTGFIENRFFSHHLVKYMIPHFVLTF